VRRKWQGRLPPERDEVRPYDEGLAGADGWEADTCTACDGGYLPVPYQEFKRAYVAGWGDSWAVTRSEIVAWCRQAVRDGGAA
jgi:hypothetical protein